MEIDYKVDLAYAKKTIGQTTCIMGNVDPTTTLYQGTPDKVREESQDCITAAAHGGRFIPGSGCMIARTTPLENVRAMVETARSYRVKMS